MFDHGGIVCIVDFTTQYCSKAWYMLS